MTSRYPNAVAWSTATHILVAAAVLFATYYSQRNLRDNLPTFELVAGAGDFFEATEAPALGDPKLSVPDVPLPAAPKIEPAPAPEPRPTTPAPAPVQAVPVTKAPAPANPTPAAKATPPPKATPAPKISYKEFEKANPQKKQQAQAKAAPIATKKVDVAGIREGVMGGSQANRTGGAGDKALTVEQRSQMESYWAFFKQRIRQEIELTPGLSNTLQATLRVVVLADGSFANPQIVKKSGSAEFDRAILDALSRIRLRARPDARAETIDVPINLRDISAQ